MAASLDAPGAKVTAMWNRLHGLPGGRWLFSVLAGRTAPYTGTIGGRVREFGDGHAVVALRDRRAVRNHLNSVHAVALVNLAEVSSGSAMLSALGPGVRGIVTGLEITYLKKARGLLTAEGRGVVPDFRGKTTVDALAAFQASARMRTCSSRASATVRWAWMTRRYSN